MATPSKVRFKICLSLDAQSAGWQLVSAHGAPGVVMPGCTGCSTAFENGEIGLHHPGDSLLLCGRCWRGRGLIEGEEIADGDAQ